MKNNNIIKIIGIIIAVVVVSWIAIPRKDPNTQGNTYSMNNRFLSVATSGAIAVGSVNQILLASTTNQLDRVYAIFVNDGGANCYLSLGRGAAVNSQIRLSANGGSYEILPENMFLGSVYGICQNGTSTITVTAQQ
jgi:hypothetical protein